jgi:hypothetical protein
MALMGMTHLWSLLRDRLTRVVDKEMQQAERVVETS